METATTNATEISREDYQRLLGLKLLADQHEKALHDICAAAAKITGEYELDSDYYGHTSDAMYTENDSVGALLKRLGIEVAAPQPEEE
jgi:hypothetical protein